MRSTNLARNANLASRSGFGKAVGVGGTQGGKIASAKKKGFTFSRQKTANDELEEFALFIRMFGFLIRDGYTPDKAVAMMSTTAKGGGLRRRQNSRLEKWSRECRCRRRFFRRDIFPPNSARSLEWASPPEVSGMLLNCTPSISRRCSRCGRGSSRP